MTDIVKVAAAAGVSLFDYQETAADQAVGQPGKERLCLYYRTGAGKTVTALVAARQWGQEAAVVIAPPATHPEWERWGERFGVKVTAMSHAKFRMKTTKLSRHTCVIADEFHMFGGHGKAGFTQLQRLAKGLEAPLIMASATPNYNDAERVFCIQTILDPTKTKGGYLQFLYTHCVTEADPFSMTPKVTGFQRFRDAEHFLASLPGVAYVKDDLVWGITDMPVLKPPMDSAYERFGYNARDHKMVASIIEDRHTRTYQGLVTVNKHIHSSVLKMVYLLAKEPCIIYCDHATIAIALHNSMAADAVPHLLVTGANTKKQKTEIIQAYRDKVAPILIGTATLATGTDGLDKVCDRLIILDDTDDDSLRRQLAGRIMPRGADSDASKKQVFRLL